MVLTHNKVQIAQTATKSSRLNGKSRRKKILSSQFCQCTGIAGILPLPVTALPSPLNSLTLISLVRSC
jgi:hypothetical protein